MIRAELTLGGQLEVINFDVETKSEAIEKVWNTYGYLPILTTPIHTVYKVREKPIP